MFIKAALTLSRRVLLTFFGIQGRENEASESRLHLPRASTAIYNENIFAITADLRYRPSLPTYLSTDTRLGAFLARLRAPISRDVTSFSLPFYFSPSRLVRDSFLHEAIIILSTQATLKNKIISRIFTEL